MVFSACSYVCLLLIVSFFLIFIMFRCQRLLFSDVLCLEVKDIESNSNYERISGFFLFSLTPCIVDIDVAITRNTTAHVRRAEDWCHSSSALQRALTACVRIAPPTEHYIEILSNVNFLSTVSLYHSNSPQCACPVVIQMAQFVRQDLDPVRNKSTLVIPDHVVARRRHAALSSALADQIEVVAKIFKIKRLLDSEDFEHTHKTHRLGRVTTSSTTVPGFGLP